MMTIVLVVVIATIFLLGLLAGERGLSRQLKRRERQLAAARYDLHQLALTGPPTGAMRAVDLDVP